MNGVHGGARGQWGRPDMPQIRVRTSTSAHRFDAIDPSDVQNWRIYRYDRSHGTAWRHHRVGSPRTAARGTHARLRAAQAPQPDARLGSAALLRVALPGTEEDAPRQPDRGSQADCDTWVTDLPSAADHLPGDRSGHSRVPPVDVGSRAHC